MFRNNCFIVTVPCVGFVRRRSPDTPLYFRVQRAPYIHILQQLNICKVMPLKVVKNA